MNTLGRSLVEGAKTAKLFGEEIVVRAEILVLPGVSGHADVDGLDRWIKSYENRLRKSLSTTARIQLPRRIRSICVTISDLTPLHLTAVRSLTL